MRFEDKKNPVDLEEKAFKVDKDKLENGDWLWWFWLFFIDNPNEFEEPRQLALLWAMKNEKYITCNGERFSFENDKNDNLEGVMASWYFDGEEMNHNHVLHKSDLKIDSFSLKTEGDPPTLFQIEGDVCEVKLGDDYHFWAEPHRGYDFAVNSRSSAEYPLGLNYSMLKSSRLDLKSEIKGETACGSAYFQRVFINAPTPSWYLSLTHIFLAGANIVNF